MSNIHSNFIDFRSEHRIYLLEGCLFELVGMMADTDYGLSGEWNENAERPTPKTNYKLIFDSEFMYNGGYYEEGELWK